MKDIDPNKTYWVEEEFQYGGRWHKAREEKSGYQLLQNLKNPNLKINSYEEKDYNYYRLPQNDYWGLI